MQREGGAAAGGAWGEGVEGLEGLLGMRWSSSWWREVVKSVVDEALTVLVKDIL